MSALRLLLAAYMICGQIAMLVFYVRTELMGIGSPVRRSSFDEFVQDIGGFFLAILIRAVAWPLVLRDWIAERAA